MESSDTTTVFSVDSSDANGLLDARLRSSETYPCYTRINKHELKPRKIYRLLQQFDEPRELCFALLDVLISEVFSFRRTEVDDLLLVNSSRRALGQSG